MPHTAPSPERRLDQLEWQARVDAELQQLREGLADVRSNTGEVVALLNSFKGAFRVLDLVGKLLRPIGYIATCVGAVLGLIALLKSGGNPK